MSSHDAGAKSGKRVVCAGIAVVDNVYRVDRFPVTGIKTRASDFAQILGGCAANAAVAVSRLGGRTRLAAPLGGPQGQDLTGDSIMAWLAGHGIDAAHCVRVDGVSSSLSSILIDRDGERLIVNHRDRRLDAARPADPDRLVADADALLIDTRFPDFVLPIARAARRKGIRVVLDGDQPTRLAGELLAASTHIVFSAEGLRGTAQTHDPEAALHAVAERTAAFVGATDGAKDMLWLMDGSLQRLPAFKVTAVDTLAAGDVFHGAFALALAESRPPREAMRFAAAASAIKCTRFGGGAGTPTRAEVEEFLRRQA